MFWSSSLRYVDFLFRVALESNPYDSGCLYLYALFQSAGGQDRRKILWLLLRAVLCDHDNAEATKLLHALLEELSFAKETKLLSLWVTKPAAVQ